MTKPWIASAVPNFREIATWRLRVGVVEIRRGALFLVNIGIPLLAGISADAPAAALLGAVVGMLLAFADDDGPLSNRLRILVVDAAAIAVGGCTGYLLKNTAAVLWPVFVALTFAVGLAARGGRVPLLAGRHAAMAFVVASAAAPFNMEQIWFLVGALVLNTVSRTIDYLALGPLPLVSATPLQTPPGYGGWVRFALAFAGAATAALWIGGTIEPTHRYWIVITTLVVMLPDAHASYRRIGERIAGTVAGVAVAWVITMALRSASIICAAILVVAPLIPHHLAQRYWLHTGLIAIMVLLAYDLTVLNEQGIGQLLVARMIDILLGCGLALVGTAVAFPRDAIGKLDRSVDRSG